MEAEISIKVASVLSNSEADLHQMIRCKEQGATDAQLLRIFR